MANLAQILKDEITRLARKEVTVATKSQKKEIIALKKTVSNLKKEIVALKGGKVQLKKQAEPAEKTAILPTESIDTTRVTAKRIIAFRQKMGISQADLGRLVGVSSVSVFQWEHKEGRLVFRKDTKARIVAIFRMRKEEVKAALEK